MLERLGERAKRGRHPQRGVVRFLAEARSETTRPSYPHARYDLRDFDQAVVDGGNVPLDVLAANVSRYIAG